MLTGLVSLSNLLFIIYDFEGISEFFFFVKKNIPFMRVDVVRAYASIT